MVENYMDYSDDMCLNMFTKGQSDRMRSAIRTYRPSLISIPNVINCGCDTPLRAEYPPTEDKLLVAPNPLKEAIVLYPTFAEDVPADIYLVDAVGRQVLYIHIASIYIYKTEIPLPPLPAGLYNLLLISARSTLCEKVIIAP